MGMEVSLKSPRLKGKYTITQNDNAPQKWTLTCHGCHPMEFDAENTEVAMKKGQQLMPLMQETDEARAARVKRSNDGKERMIARVAAGTAPHLKSPTARKKTEGK